MICRFATGWLVVINLAVELRGNADSTIVVAHAVDSRQSQPKPEATAPALLRPEFPNEPGEDLLLTGLVRFPGVSRAYFAITCLGQPPVYFALAEGEQNEWLDIYSIDATTLTVKARLKKAVVRIRGVGTEVLLSFQTHGRR